jgi:regulator of protease activity HflC (stomatin/prohibitin superfamily)
MSQTLILTVLSIVALLAFLSVKRIPEGTVYTLRRLGGQARTLTSGTHFVLPLIERIVHRISLTGRTLAVDESMPVDGNSRRLSGQIWWQVIDAERADPMIERADELIRTRVVNAVRDIEQPAEEAADSRNLRLKKALNDTLRERGVVVTRVQLSFA